MTLYQKIISVAGAFRNLVGQKADKTTLAPEFSPDVLVQEGRLVIYEGKLYRCTSDHVGTWDPSHFEETTVDEALALKGGSHTGGDLYVKDTNGEFHKVVVEYDEDLGAWTLAVDQDAVTVDSGESTEEAAE